MRVFTALPVPADIACDLDERLDGLRSARPDLRWQPAVKWHITLEFLGDCGPREVERQLDRWERRGHRSGPLRLHLAGVGTFGAAVIARVLWAGVGGDLDGLRKLASYGQHPHVTLARTREAIDLTAVVDEISGYRGPEWTATDLELVESVLHGGRGSRYRTVERLPLGGRSWDGDDGAKDHGGPGATGE